MKPAGSRSRPGSRPNPMGGSYTPTSGGGWSGVGEVANTPPRGHYPTTEAEAQLLDLHRKYRMMEGNRKQYSEDSQSVIRRQRTKIEKLKHDNMLLKQELDALFRGDNPGASHLEAQQELLDLQDVVDSHIRQIDAEKHKIERVEQSINMLVVKALETRRQIGGVNACKEMVLHGNKHIKVLENRLERALVKFNETLAYNRNLRMQIDNLRRERVAFESLYQKLERELHEKKKEMANVIEISNIAYEARDQAQNEIAALKAQADREQQAFELEWKELGRLIEMGQRIHDMIKLTSGRTARKKRMGDAEERKRRRGSLKRGRGDRGSRSSVSVNVQTYEEAFTKIHKATGIEDIDELVTLFINTEDKNFSLFNYVNELNQEAEKLEEALGETKAEIERYRGQGLTTDHQRKKIITELEERLRQMEERSQHFEGKYSKAMRSINALKFQVQSLFNRIGCNTPYVREILGEGGVTESNLLQYLGIIEQRANEILLMYALHQNRVQSSSIDLSPMQQHQLQHVDHRVLINQGPSSPSGAAQIAIEPPVTSDEYMSEEDSDEELDDRPISRSELVEKAVRRIQKREASGKMRTNVRRTNTKRFQVS